MGIVASIVSAVLKSVVGDKLGSGLIKELADISIDGISEKGINEITDFINDGKSKIDRILSEENMKSMNISEDHIDYVLAEIKDLFSKINITDDVLRQCKYNESNLKDFMWNKYIACRNKPGHIECESEIKACLFAVAEVLNRVKSESEEFSKKMMIQISNSVDDANIGLRKISEYMEYNFAKLDNNSQIVLNILLMILEQIQTMNMKDNETKSTTNEVKKFKNNKKEDYIKTWNSRLFLHIDNDENPITLEDAYIVPDYTMYKSIKRIGFSDNDPLDMIIEKFVNYGKTSTMLITGVPGIGKSTITSWMANKYKDNERIVVLRFRDWKKVMLEKKLLEAICKKLDCEEEDLENKVLVLDGFDEMKALNIRDRLLNEFFADIKDFENLKCIITSRTGYIDSSQFHNVLKLKKFDIKRVEDFVKIITGDVLKNREKIESNLEVLGIPVILYMAVMSNIDISENPTKPELYNRIFAEEGGIFDRFSSEGIGYDNGAQVLRNSENIKVYLSFLQKVSFTMFENNSLSLKMEQCNVPELEYQGDKVSVLEFPIKHLFENAEINVEFIHKSIYEYFVSEYIFMSIYKLQNMIEDNLAKVFGSVLKQILTKEVLEFLEYKIKNSKLNYRFDIVNKTFLLMVQNGMTFYTNGYSGTSITCEMVIFRNMLEIIHLWDEDYTTSYNFICNYLNCNSEFELNLRALNLKGAILKGVDLAEADLRFADLRGTNLTRSDLSFSNLCKTDLRGANLQGACLKSAYLGETKLRGADLRRADLRKARLNGTDLRNANLKGADLREANFLETIFTNRQIRKLDDKYYLKKSKVYIPETDSIISYEEYKNSLE